MPTVQQLPQVASPGANDQILLQQPTKTAAITVANLLADTQQKLVLAHGSLLGRASNLPGTPEPVEIAASLTMQSGTLSANMDVVAPLVSPAFIGKPIAPTPTAGDSSDRIATTAFVQARTSPLAAGTGLILQANTLSIDAGILAPIASPSLTGTPTAPTPVSTDSSNRIATTAFVQARTTPLAAGSGLVLQTGTLSADVGVVALLASPSLTGAPTAPTPAAADNSTRLATTAFVQNQNYVRGQTLSSVAMTGKFTDLLNRPDLGVLAGLNTFDGQDSSAMKTVASGAIASRTQADRASDRINVLDFGADPTGVADSYAAFNSAIAAGRSGQAVHLFVPRGTYRLSANVADFGGLVSIELDDGASLIGGILYVGRTEQRKGALRTTLVQGSPDPSNQTIGEFQNVANVGSKAGAGYYYHYDNDNTVSTNANGGDVGINTVQQWHQIAGTAGLGQWHVTISPYADVPSTSQGNNWAIVSAEYNIVNNGPETGWSDLPGSQSTWTSGPYVETDAWSPTGGFGGHSLFAWAATTGHAPNNRWSSYPAVFGFANPGPVLLTDQISINNNVVTLDGGGHSGSTADVAASINAAGIPNTAASVDSFGRLVIFSTAPSNNGVLTISNAHGNPLNTLGIYPSTYTATRGPATILRGASYPQPVGSNDAIRIKTPHTSAEGTVIALGGGARLAADVVAAINSAGIPYVGAWLAYSGEVAIAEFSPGPVTLTNVSGTPLATLGLPAGTTQPTGAPTSASGPYVPGTYTGFLVTKDAIAPGGRAFYAGGANLATASLLPYAPFEARYNWAHGVRLEQASLADCVALTMAACHTIAWGTGASAALVMTAPTVSALRAIPASSLVDGTSVNLLAFATRGDGGGGTLTWNATSNNADNGGTVVNPTANPGPGRWLRQLGDGRLTPQMFGARGDGATDDTAAFSAALSAGPVIVPSAKYVVGNVIVPNGAWMEGGAGLGYSGDIGVGTPNAGQKAAVVSPVLIAKPGTTSCILNVNGCNDATLKGLFLDGVTGICDGISSGSTQLMIERVTAVRCLNGLGSTSASGYVGLSDLYTHVATLINCQFANCLNGIANLIDSVMLGGACSACTVGVNLGSGANANTFAGCRFEWCYQDGVQGFASASNVFIGGLFDRNAWRALNLGAGCNDYTFTGVQFARNGSNNAYPNNSHVALNGTSSVFFNGCVSRTGKNDDGTGTPSPAYFINYINTNAIVTISGCDVSGYTAGFAFGPSPTSYVQRDNFGAGDTFVNAARPFVTGGAVRQTINTKAGANVTPGTTTTIPMGQSPILANYSATARELVITAVNFNSPYQTISASYRLVFYRDTSVHTPLSSNVFAEVGGTGQITFGTSSELQLSITGVVPDGSSFVLNVKNGGAADGSNWGVWAELQ